MTGGLLDSDRHAGSRARRAATPAPRLALLALGMALALGAAPAAAQAPGATPETVRSETGEELVNLDFDDVELAVVIDTIARLTGRNFVYDDRVRGRVTIVSPTPVPLEQAYTVFESVLQVKGFTTVDAPGGVTKVIPIRDAKESSIDTREGGLATPISDRFITRLIPLSYIDAEAISNTLKPLVSKEASLVAYPPTNTVILTDAASNIRRILSILEAIDVETYKEELAMIRLRYADATTMAQQLSEIFGAEVSSTATPTTTARSRRRRIQQAQEAAQSPGRGEVRILTDERTNSLIVLASRGSLEDIRSLVRKLDVPVEGQGRIQVYYLRHADAEELANTLNALLTGSPTTGAVAGEAGRGAAPQQLRAAVTELAGGVTTLTADPQTNSLVIQASPEGYEALRLVIERLDIPRPQVLVEALIMEVDVTDSLDLGFSGVVRLFNGDTNIGIQSATGPGATALLGGGAGAGIEAGRTFLAGLLRQSVEVDSEGNVVGNGSIIQSVISASATDNSTNIISAPHILTSDNEEAEILVGDNIPIITSRVQSAQGIQASDNLATSVNVERQDIGVTLRVTPQITEGDSLRLQIFQEITDVNPGLQTEVGDEDSVGVALSNRRIENTVVVKDDETVVIGGLISDDYDDTLTKVPWLGDIPLLGWLFKTTGKSLTKRNLLIFLTPHIIRTGEDLEKESIRKREEFRLRSEQALDFESDDDEPHVTPQALEILTDVSKDGEKNPARTVVRALDRRYPLERMIELEKLEEERGLRESGAVGEIDENTYAVLGAIYRDATAAQDALTELVDAGFDGTLTSQERDGVLVFELYLGPYETAEDAQRAARILREAYELPHAQVVIQYAEGDEDEETP